MVGVPGKFKGCNTCRTRRVKCDNLRPKCQKCLDSGRDCGGYERQMIFIVGTTDDRGRCSSHPHRSLLAANPKKTKELPRPKAASKASRAENEGRPAPTWTSVNPVSTDSIQYVFLHAKSLSLEPYYDPEGDAFTLPRVVHSLPEFAGTGPMPEFSLHAFSFLQEPKATYGTDPVDGDVNPRAKKKAHFAHNIPETSSVGQSQPANAALFIYEHTGIPAEEAGPFRHLRGGSSSTIKQRGPSSFQKFPDHQFFSILYRPSACFDAMSRRKSTFLASPEWCAGPWEDIPKSDLDRLFDIQVMLPGIFERAERTGALKPSLYRKLKAKDLLDNCNRLDKSFEEWFSDLNSKSDLPLYKWVGASHAFSSRKTRDWKPRYELENLFPEHIEFVDVKTAFLHLYYWAALCLFYQTIQQLQLNCMETGIPTQPTLPTTQPFLPDSSGGFMSSSTPAYSTPSSHNSISPPADMFGQVALEPSIYTQTPYSSFPTSTYPSSIPDSTAAYNPAPPALYDDFSESFLFSTGAPIPAPPPIDPSSLPYQSLNLQDQSFYFPQTPSPHAQHSPHSQNSHPSPSSFRLSTPTHPSCSAHSSPPVSAPSPDTKFSPVSVLDLANKICQTIPFVLHHEQGVETVGPDMLAWPLRTARMAYEREGCGVEAEWCGKVRGVLEKEGWGFARRIAGRRWRVVGDDEDEEDEDN